MTGRGQGSAWRARRRDVATSHWPPACSPATSELLAGRTPRQLTRRQRVEIVALIERSPHFDWLFEAEVRAIADNKERPALRLARLLRINQTSPRDAGESD